MPVTDEKKFSCLNPKTVIQFEMSHSCYFCIDRKKYKIKVDMNIRCDYEQYLKVSTKRNASFCHHCLPNNKILMKNSISNE